MVGSMLPGGGFVNPGWRPTNGGYSEEDKQSTEQVLSARDLAQRGGLSEDNYLDYMIGRANKGNQSAIDWLVSYWSNKESEKSAREWTAMREDSAYQRLNEDLKKAGISPYVLSGATPGVSSASAKSYSGSDFALQEAKEKSNRTDIAQRSLLVFGIIFSALLRAML